MQLFQIICHLFLIPSTLGMSKNLKLELRDRARSMFEHAYNGYMTYGYPADELDPINCKGKSRNSNPDDWGMNDVLLGSSLTLIDTLDTLAIIGKQEDFEEAVRLVMNRDFNLDARVQVFEVTIRVLGGLLSAHLLATDDRLGFKISWYNGELLEMARDLADRLMPAFKTPFGLPFPRVNLRLGVVKNEVREACTAGAGTLILEFGTLSRLTGDPQYERAAKKALLEVWRRRSELDLLGTTMNLFNEQWVEEISGIGASSDSFYEYLLKGHILLGDEEYLGMFDQSYSAILHWIMDTHGFIYKNVNMNTGHLSTQWIDSLAAFFPGLQVLFGDVELATKPHLLYYTLWQRFGALPERFNFQTKETPIASYPLRPELIESTYMLYQATKNPFYLHVGERILSDLERYTKTKCGYVGLKDVRTKAKGDRMESFFLSETLKYLFLLFDEDNSVNLLDSNAVFTTEGHFLPLPYNYTTKRGKSSSSSSRSCLNPSFLNDFAPSLQAPLKPGWTNKVQSFVGEFVNSKVSNFNEDDGIVSRFFSAVSVILPLGKGQHVGRIVATPDFVLLDSIRGLAITISLDGSSIMYKTIAISDVSLENRKIRSFLDIPLPSNTNEPYFAVISHGSHVFYGGVVDFGPLMFHGMALDGSFIICDSCYHHYSPQSLKEYYEKIIVFPPSNSENGFADIIEKTIFVNAVRGAKAAIFVSDEHSARMNIPRNHLESQFTVPIFYISSDSYGELLYYMPSKLSVSVAFHKLLRSSQVEPGRITYMGKELDVEFIAPPPLIMPENPTHRNSFRRSHLPLSPWRMMCSIDRCFQ